MPPSGSHPVIIARKLLLLASWLQGTPPGYRVTTGPGPGEDYHDYACRLVSTASKLVMRNDELLTSIEGIECLMLESMYLNNGGHLRRAWFTSRKALAVAQMLGIHQGTGSSAGTWLDEDASRTRIDPDYMWLRLVLTDRYLSLMLGLPQGTLENVFATPEALSDCAGLERFERMLGVAAGLILQRNSVQRLDLGYTQKIDTLLQEAANCLPAQWWVVENPRSSDGASDDFQQSLRLVNQIAYHHLLIQLHLPYLLQSPPVPSGYDYNKMTAAIASRNILVQFIAFRASETNTVYCRGIDFITFTASMTLCLAHMECRRRRSSDDTHTNAGAVDSSSAFHALRHQRLSDRGLVERTLQIMDDMAALNEDVVVRKISQLLTPLLEIESDAASGEGYRASSSSCVHAAAAAPESQWTSEMARGASHGLLSVQIPYFGTIKIEHSQGDSTATGSNQTGPSLVSRYDFAAQSVGQFDPGPQMPPPRHHAGYEMTNVQPANTDWQPVPSFVDQLSPPILPSQTSVTISEDAPSSKAPSLETVSGLEEKDCLLVPGLEADLEDWVLQGVDGAFFSSLIQE
ncbi:hypothetical protein PG985_013553 [Apiospora marii]|uniref:Xylanolytic transcriptional activator regulatory domain-containing protein n=1 Tax=Apiospora marii TaxID=335849 RepID=A0ABR1R7I9_9PEZI